MTQLLTVFKCFTAIIYGYNRLCCITHLLAFSRQSNGFWLFLVTLVSVPAPSSVTVNILITITMYGQILIFIFQCFFFGEWSFVKLSCYIVYLLHGVEAGPAVIFSLAESLLFLVQKVTWIGDPIWKPSHNILYLTFFLFFSFLCFYCLLTAADSWLSIIVSLPVRQSVQVHHCWMAPHQANKIAHCSCSQK